MTFEVEKLKAQTSPAMQEAYLKDIKNVLHSAYSDLPGTDFGFFLNKLIKYIEEKKESLR